MPLPDSPPPVADSLAVRVATSLRSAGVVDARVVVGVSGGADSTALLVLLSDVRQVLGLKLRAAHFDHRMRPDSAADAAWVAGLCEQLGVEVASRAVEGVGESSLSSEAAARDARRRFLAETATSWDARWVALGHTADDQVETVLHRLLRGTGPRGLAGMSSVADLAAGVRVVRPLLGIARSELTDWLTARSLAWRTDATNADTAFTRNRIRHLLLPLLRDQFNPQVDAALLRLAEQCRDVSDWLRVMAMEGLKSAMLERRSSYVRLDQRKLRSMPRPVLREAFVALWGEQQWGEQAMSFEHWERLADAAASTAPVRFQVPPGVDVTADGSVMRLAASAGWSDSKI